MALCAEGNPNALEILFADERDWVFETPTWRRLHQERHRFLTKKVQQTFLGYAMAQLKKIKSHPSWLLNPPAKKQSREDFGLPVAGGTLNRDDQDSIEQSVADIDARMRAVSADAMRLPPDVMAAFNAEKKYRAAKKRCASYQTWKSQRNPARAELERQYGYDSKHAMHLIRLMRMGLEVLETGDLRVRRDDADELSAIRDGAMSFDELLAAATGLQENMARAAATTTLPDDVDRERVDALAIALMSEASA